MGGGSAGDPWITTKDLFEGFNMQQETRQQRGVSCGKPGSVLILLRGGKDRFLDSRNHRFANANRGFKKCLLNGIRECFMTHIVTSVTFFQPPPPR